MAKKIKILKVTSPLVSERGIKVNDEMDVISEGPSDKPGGDYTYLVQGPTGTAIVVYKNEISIIN